MIRRLLKSGCCLIVMVYSTQAQELQLDHDRLRFDISNIEHAGLNYQYYPFGPLLELKSNHYLGTLRLNSTFKIDFRTGGSSVSHVGIDQSGYIKLGNDSPAIRMKMLYGTSASTVNGGSQLPHGLVDANRILSVQVHMNFQPGGNDVYFPAEIAFDNQNFTYFWDDYNVTIQNNASAGSTSILNKPVRALVIYQQ